MSYVAELKTKNILIVGGGTTGKSLANYLDSLGAEFDIFDEKDSTIAGIETLTDISDYSIYDLAIVSPGWKATHPLVRRFVEAGVEITNEIDLAWMIKQEQAPHQRWFALTGTNGKTTTVEMTAAAMRAGGLHATACGNVGDTVIDAVESKDKFDVLVLELSSFQIHWMQAKHADQSFSFFDCNGISEIFLPLP